MINHDLVKAIVNFLARHRNGSQDIVEIFQSIMEPSPKHPERWAKMTGILDEMRQDGLVQATKQYLEGRRVAIFYQLTAEGWTTARRGSTSPLDSAHGKLTTGGEQADENRG